MNPALTDALESLRFSLSDTTGLEAQEMSPLHAWLLRNPGAWRVSRSDLISAEARATGGSLLVVGEAGCGKTTLMAEEADLHRSSPNQFVAHINFLDADGLDHTTRFENVRNRTGRFLRAQIEKSINLVNGAQIADIWDDYSAARVRTILDSISGGYLNQAKKEFGPRIGQMTPAQILNESLLSQVLIDFDSQGQEGMVALRAVQRMVTVERVVVMFDNLDSLGGENASLALEAIIKTRKITGLYYFALRNENEYATANLSAYIAERICVPPPPLPEVVRTRLNGVAAYHVFRGLTPPRGLKTMTAETQKAARALGDDRTLLAKWHNFNTRNILGFLLVHRKPMAQAMPSNEARGALLSRLIWNVDAHNDYLLAMLNGSDTSAHGKPFLFLKLRILAYLRKHDQKCDLRALVSVMGKYNVKRADVDAAVTRLSQPMTVLGAFARRSQDSSGRTQVSLLPAGDLFISEIAHSAEFLSYHDQKDRGVEEWDSIETLSSACNFAESVLLPAFLDEHPYLQEHVEPTRQDQARLLRYRDDFGYTRDQWFISAMKRSLVKYARAHGVNPDATTGSPTPQEWRDAADALVRTIGKITAMELALATVLDINFEGR